MSDYLPNEVWVEILTRLPIKTLIQFMSVCKFWYSLISSSSFITTHLKKSQINQTHNEKLLLRYFTDRVRQNKEHYLLLDDDNQTLGVHSEELIFPIKSKSDYQLRIVGSINGLLCLLDDSFGHEGDIILFNPSIRKFLTLPRPRVSEITHGSYFFVLGFGYDHRNDDYKLVRVSYMKGRNGFDLIPPEVEVYSVNSWKWRSFSTGAPPYGMFGYTWSKAFLNGVVHWIGYDPCVSKGNNSLIVSFDVGDEVFGELKLPDELADQSGKNLSVVVFGESLLVIQYYFHGKRQCCSVWLLKEYGVVDSWTKLYSIDIEGGLQKVIGFRKNGEVLLATARGKLISYHPIKEWTASVGFRGATDSFFVDAYTESLVLIGAESVDLHASSSDDNKDEGRESGGFEDRRWTGVIGEDRKNGFSESERGEETDPLSFDPRSAESEYSDCSADNCEEWDKALAAMLKQRADEKE